jgi:hypothetical protein
VVSGLLRVILAGLTFNSARNADGHKTQMKTKPINRNWEGKKGASLFSIVGTVAGRRAVGGKNPFCMNDYNVPEAAKQETCEERTVILFPTGP